MTWWDKTKSFAGGTLLGGGVGGLFGALKGPIGSFIGMDDDQRQGFIDQGQQGYAQRSQDINGLVAQLQAAAAGQGPSLAQAQLQRAGDQAMSQQQALAASARPGQGGLAQRLAAQQSSRIGGDLAQQSALLRLQEQQQAQNALAQLLAQARGQDMNAYLGGNQIPTVGDRILSTGGQVLGFAMGRGGAGG